MVEFCSSAGEYEQCMNGEWLILAIIVELTFYFVAFVVGHITLNWIKKQWRNRKRH